MATAKWEHLDKLRLQKKKNQQRGSIILFTIAPYHNMQEAVSHDCARLLHFAHPLLPSQQPLMQVAPTTHQAAEMFAISE